MPHPTNSKASYRYKQKKKPPQRHDGRQTPWEQSRKKKEVSVGIFSFYLFDDATATSSSSSVCHRSTTTGVANGPLGKTSVEAAVVVVLVQVLSAIMAVIYQNFISWYSWFVARFQ